MLPAASASATCATPSGVASPRNFAKPLQKGGIRRARQQGREQRVFLRAGEIDFVDAGGLVVLVVEIGPQDRARDAGRRFDREHPLGWNPRPIRYRRLGNSDSARKLGDAAGGADRFLESSVCHVVSLPSPVFYCRFFGRDRLEMASSEPLKARPSGNTGSIAGGYKSGHYLGSAPPCPCGRDGGTSSR